MKLKKTKKSKKQRGNTTHGHGARKKWKKSGHRGGCGMAGTGKRGDQKKSLIIKKYGNKYFGKQGVTSRRSAKKKNKVINIGDIERKFPGKSEIDLSDYKLLGSGELSRKVKLKVREASSQAIKKVEKAGGSVEILKVKKDKKNIINVKQDKEIEEIKESESIEQDEKIEQAREDSSDLSVNNKDEKKEEVK